MSIFKLEPKPEDRLQELKEEIIRNNFHGLRRLEVLHRQNFNNIWHNSEYTAQEVLDLFGTDAVQLFVASKATQDFLKAFNPDYVELVPPQEFTINDDGTVTVKQLVTPEENLVE